jgi:hypothetical protein
MNKPINGYQSYPDFNQKNNQISINNDDNWKKHLEKLKKMVDRFENVLNNRKSEIDPVFQEKLIKPDSTQNSLKNFPHFPHYLRMFIFYWIKRGEISKKFLFVEEEFDILDQYGDWFTKSLILIQDEHPNQNLEEMQTAAGGLLGYVTALRDLTHYNCIVGYARNANDPDTSEVEKLLSMGAAYIQLFTKAFFIVAIWRKKWAGPKLESIREDVLDQFITELLTSSTPGQILLPDELKSSAALIEFIDILFRFDERLDADE